MRPGGLERRGLGFDKLLEVNPKIVFLTISGYGLTGPYRDYPSHGIAYDTWAGVINPAVDEDGFTYIPEHVSVGINAGPLYGAFGILAGITQARATGHGCRLEVAQSDAAASIDWLRSETWRAYERPQSEVTGNASDGGRRRAPGTAGMKEGVRYNIYESSDGHVLFMASERAFWKNFAEGVGRADLFEKWPGEQYADHATGNVELHHELKTIFKSRTTQEWLDFGGEVNTPLAPVNTPQTLINDPQFKDRLPWIPKEQLGADMLPFPVKVVGGELAWPTRAPTLGQHTDDILRSRLGYDEAKIAELRAAGALGGPEAT
jgi:crotonobetainyl-CoA:carnitine CoA-transferase CaiB-like acyl-CoA transferase